MRSEPDRGSAVVEFALVTPLLAAVVLAVVQLAAWAVQRSEAHDVAFAAARAGSRAAGTPAERVAVAGRAVAAARPGGGHAHVDHVAHVARVDGIDAVVVEIAVPLLVLGWRVPVDPVSSHMAIEPR